MKETIDKKIKSTIVNKDLNIDLKNLIFSNDFYNEPIIDSYNINKEKIIEIIETINK